MISRDQLHNFFCSLNNNYRTCFPTQKPEEVFFKWYFGYCINERYTALTKTLGQKISFSFNNQNKFLIEKIGFKIDVRYAYSGLELRVQDLIAEATCKEGKNKSLSYFEIYLPSGQRLTLVNLDNTEPETNVRLQQATDIAINDLCMMDLIIKEAMFKISETMAEYHKTTILEPKHLDEFCYHLGISDPIEATFKVLKQNQNGPKGEDVIVQCLVNGEVNHRHSYEFGNITEWYEATKKYKNLCGPTTEPTEKEVKVFDTFMSDLNAAIKNIKKPDNTNTGQ